jgi:8-oxo-dGTP pyrophosphatase MutT (NUDIX family)
VGAAQKRCARDASVLILLMDDAEPSVLLTRRAEGIRYGGHQVFPGGLRDDEDASAQVAMFRELDEEIGLAAEDISILGRFADYYTHTGYRIAAFVGTAAPPVTVSLNAAEVAAVSYVPLRAFCDASRYELKVRSQSPRRANFHLTFNDIHITGPTISLLISLYQALARNAGPNGSSL